MWEKHLVYMSGCLLYSRVDNVCQAVIRPILMYHSYILELNTPISDELLSNMCETISPVVYSSTPVQWLDTTFLLYVKGESIGMLELGSSDL